MDRYAGQSGERRIRIIWARPKPVGLFSLFIQVVEQLGLCEQAGVTPAVYFNATCLYWNEAGYRDARNVWEYYFEPVSDVDPAACIPIPRNQLEHADIYEFTNRRVFDYVPPQCPPESIDSIKLPDSIEINSEFEHKLVPAIFDPSPAERRTLGAIISRHIKIKKGITAVVDRFVEKNLNGRYIIGVHIRGNEHADERGYFIRGGILDTAYYFKEIDVALARHPDAVLLCASDGAHYIQALKERYGDRAVSYDAKRTSQKEEGIGVHNLDLDNKAVLGDDVLIETLLLARCNFLIHGPSNLISAALILNPDMAHVNVYMRYGKLFPRQRYRARRSLDRLKASLSNRYPRLYSGAKEIVRGRGA